MRTPISSAETTIPTPEGVRCEAPGCGAVLTPAQLVRRARACSPSCRRRAHRARQRAALEARIARVASELAELRALVGRLG